MTSTGPPVAGITTKEILSIAETVARLSELIEARGMKLFAVIDQSAEARRVGLDLRPTTLIIFWQPRRWDRGDGRRPPLRSRPAPQGSCLG